jgi:membrane-associated phospholipid phosphatase
LKKIKRTLFAFLTLPILYPMKNLNLKENHYPNFEGQAPVPVNFTRKIKLILAHTISFIYIPFLAPTYLFILIFYYFPSLAPAFGNVQKVTAIVSILAATTILPLALVYVLFKYNKIESMLLENKRDRLIPQVFSCFLYAVITLFLIIRFGHTNVLSLVMLANTVSLILISLITPYWKISTHACSAFGTFSIVACLYFRYPSVAFQIPCLYILIITLLVCISRLYLRVHTPLQIILGSLLGSLIGVLLFSY